MWLMHIKYVKMNWEKVKGFLDYRVSSGAVWHKEWLYICKIRIRLRVMGVALGLSAIYSHVLTWRIFVLCCFVLAKAQSGALLSTGSLRIDHCVAIGEGHNALCWNCASFLILLFAVLFCLGCQKIASTAYFNVTTVFPFVPVSAMGETIENVSVVEKAHIGVTQGFTLNNPIELTFDEMHNLQLVCFVCFNLQCCYIDNIKKK